jgi:hypothetical protein
MRPLPSVERMQRYEPQARQSSLDECRFAGFFVGPREETRCLIQQYISGR